MEKTLYKKIVIPLVLLLILQSVFGNFYVGVQANAPTASLVITMTSDNQLYEEGTIATSAVMVHATSTSADSAGVQIDYSLDEGVTWYPYSQENPLLFSEIGDYFVWFREAGNASFIERRHIQIQAPISQAALLTATITTPASAGIIFVNQFSPVATAHQNGQSWETAYSDLQKALTSATAGTEIWVAKGTYKPTTGTNRNAAFKMKNGMQLYGGFSGVETARHERDFKHNETILSGEIGDQLKTDNSYNVIRNDYTAKDPLTNTAILDGFTITGGYAGANVNNSGYTCNGGGIYNSYSNAIFRNLVIEDNYASRAGGGIFTMMSKAVFIDSEVKNNSVKTWGGGLDFENNEEEIIVENVIVEGNGANYGGGISIYSTKNIYLKDVTITGNTGTTEGGGIYNEMSAGKIENALIAENQSKTGSAIYVKDTANKNSTKITNTTITKNEDSTSTSSPVSASKTTNVIEIVNSIIAGNTRNQAITASGVTVSYSLIGDDSKGRFYISKSNVQNTSISMDSIFKDVMNKNYQLKAGSFAVNKGNNSYVTRQEDLIGNDRIYKGTVDLGAYERTYGELSYDGNGATAGLVPADVTAYELNESVVVQDNSKNLAKTDHTFNGWNTKADGTGTDYVAGAALTIDRPDVILYAKWTKNPTFSVTYDGNGATGGLAPNDSTEYRANGRVNVQGKDSLEKSGYTFAGWNTVAAGMGTAYATGATFTIAANVTLYAQWTKSPTYSALYDGNGATIGQAPVDSTEYEENQQVTVQTKGSLEKLGYTFTGWNTKADGTGTAYAAGAMFTMGAANVTLYAKWTKNPTFGVTYDSNGATDGQTPSDANQYEENQQVTVQAKGSLEKTGYTFISWNTKADGTGTDYTTGATLTMGTANLMLYAKWTLIPNPAPTSVELAPNPAPTPVQPAPVLEELKAEVSEPAQPVNSFTDTQFHWARDIIEEIAAQGIITGYEDGTFRPNESVLRKHIAVMLQRALDLQAIRQVNGFSDVPKNHTYYDAIMELANAGITDGDKGNYNPDAPMTRAQLAKVLVLTFGLTPGGNSTFKDVSENHWSYPYIAALADAGIALGEDGNFRPNEPVTRAQFVAMLYRALNL